MHFVIKKIRNKQYIEDRERKFAFNEKSCKSSDVQQQVMFDRYYYLFLLCEFSLAVCLLTFSHITTNSKMITRIYFI